MTKPQLAELIEAYADAKVSANNHLLKLVVAELNIALDMLFPATQEPAEETKE